MARATHKPRVAPAPAPPPSGRGFRVSIPVILAFLVAAALGVWYIHTYVGPGRPIVNIAELDRQSDIRRSSIEAITRTEQLLRDGRLDEARKLAEQVTEKDPNFFPGHLVLGFIHMRSGRLPLAEQATRRACQLEPNDHAVTFQLGQVELLQGKNESAVEQFTRAIAIQERTNARPEAKYHLMLGDALIQSGRADQAVSQLKAALDIDRGETLKTAALVDPQTQIQLGRLLIDRREMVDATRLFEQAAAQVPDRAEVHYQAARAYYVQGKFAEAAPLIEKAVELDPANPTYVQLRRQVNARQFGTSETLPATPLELVPGANTDKDEQDRQLPGLFK
jgi:tetratricopeptide (TPR) repeat protein